MSEWRLSDEQIDGLVAAFKAAGRSFEEFGEAMVRMGDAFAAVWPSVERDYDQENVDRLYLWLTRVCWASVVLWGLWVVLIGIPRLGT